jgi:hypothetical protein
MIERRNWNNSSMYKTPPEFTCPNCKSGKLILRKDAKIKDDTIGSQFAIKETGYGEYYFSVILGCNDEECGQNVLVSGEQRVIKTNGISLNTESGGYENEQVLKIIYINPPINLIEIPSTIPIILRRILELSFTLFWIDEKSCANKIRLFLEELMDKKNILMGSSLHNRIEKFGKEYPELLETSKLLLALKWIGNEGSHSGYELSRENLIQGYELLEAVLEELFGTKKEKLKELARQINQKKGISKLKK